MKNRYSSIAIGLHWLIAILILGQLIGGKLMGAISNGATRFELYQLHKSIGITILILSVLRLGWRLAHRPPPLPAMMKTWERTTAKATHWIFYGLMIGLPLSGWLMVSASETNIPTRLFQIVPWPDFPGIPRSESVEDRFEMLHEWAAYVFAALILLHIGAALKHHFIERDDVLARMLPLTRRKANDA